MINMTASAAVIFGGRAFFGNTIEKPIINYLGHNKAHWATLIFYCGAFVYLWTRFDNRPNLDVN